MLRISPMNTILLILLSLWILKANCKFLKKKPKLTSTSNYIRTCPIDKDSQQKFSIDIKRINQTSKVLSANWTMMEPFDSSYNFDGEIWKWDDGEWKNFIIVKRKDACSSMYQLIGPAWAEAMTASHIKLSCPTEPGSYQLDSYIASSNLASSPFAVWPGLFYYVLRVLKYGKVAICVEFEIEYTEYFIDE